MLQNDGLFGAVDRAVVTMRRMRWVVLLCLAAGCNQAFGLDPTDLAGVTECATVRFGPKQPLAGFVGDIPEFDPQLGPDGTELWLTHYDNGELDMYRAARPDRNADFVTPAVKAELVPGVRTMDASLSGDGRRMLFLQGVVAPKDRQVYEGVRANPKSPIFDSIRIVIGIDVSTTGIDGIDLSWDGLTLYYSDSDGMLWRTRRPSLDEPFADKQALFSNISWLSVTPDELEIFYNRPSDGGNPPVYRRSRDTRDGDFVNEELVLPAGYDPDVSSDATQLIIGVDNGLAVLSRECP